MKMVLSISFTIEYKDDERQRTEKRIRITVPTKKAGFRAPQTV